MLPAGQLACLYDQYVAAVRRGDEEIADAFAAWLGEFWDAGPAEPKSPPSAISLLGGIGRGVRWYQTETMVLGYVRGWPRRGCYQVPVAELAANAARVAVAA
ncbi:MAG: hypothetical protein AVDCRST_MAG19-3365 [uncultured Thermomicrobiales bacterium]|uniref:Uncharacterized protein n=1 Tax=uncultured Thermomicrobiales bacterium TaxID=1645740 RepID=A0A6J4VDJ8_9BACT|nr:MAG: hypothetical protein AVDCRST_MAG19-3365 [uncultured Thermomicrobiales bacterium]